MGGELRLEVLVLVVDAGQALAVKHAVVAAVMDPGTVLHTLKMENIKLNLIFTISSCKFLRTSLCFLIVIS